MIKVEFYFDPSCPWCWVTSRWLLEVKDHREMEITWLPFSLSLKNGELEGEDTTGHQEPHNRAHKILRVIEAIVQDKQMDRGDLYTAFSRTYFIDGGVPDENLIPAVLEKLGLESSYVNAADETAFDEPLQNHLNNAIDIVGDDVGVPLIIFVNEDGEKQGYFGPVLQGLPDLEEGLRIWDGLSALASSKHFFELKRGRNGGAMVPTTKRVFD